MPVVMTYADESIPGGPGDKNQSADDIGPPCGQCGRISELDCVFCQTCGSLLPDPDPNPIFTQAGGTDESGARRLGVRVVASTVMLIALVAATVLVVLRATEPEPEERLAEDSSHRALTLLKSFSAAQTLDQAREISPAGQTALAPIVEMLPRLSSDNDTRPRLDAYRSFFRGVASLEYLHRSQIQEWGKTRQLITSSLRELAADDPLTGALTSLGRVAIDNIQDQVDEIQRTRGVREEQRTVGP